MECTWHELVVGLEEEPTLSLAVVEPESDPPSDFVFHISPAGVVEPIPGGGFAPANSDVDWDRLEILARNDDEGRLDIVGDDQFYELLGLRAEDEAEFARQAGAHGVRLDVASATVGEGAASADGCDVTRATIPVHDEVPGERVMARGR
uniref:Uncharacterized protein n=1 Tax=Oryza brachyantha TaxID=4533 RepID=J3MJD3_ORYBR